MLHAHLPTNASTYITLSSIFTFSITATASAVRIMVLMAKMKPEPHVMLHAEETQLRNVVAPGGTLSIVLKVHTTTIILPQKQYFYY